MNERSQKRKNTTNTLDASEAQQKVYKEALKYARNGDFCWVSSMKEATIGKGIYTVLDFKYIKERLEHLAKHLKMSKNMGKLKDTIFHETTKQVVSLSVDQLEEVLDAKFELAVQ